MTLVGGSVLLNVPLSRRISLYGTAGATSISHSGIGTDRASVSYLAGMDFPTAHGTVAGAGVRVALRDGLALRLQVADYHYTMQVSGDGRGTLGNKVQDDLVAMTGISIAPFGFRGSAQQ